MRCPECNGTKFVYNALGDFEEDCGYCHGTGNVAEPHTNEAWFCGLSAEEKAMAIVLCCPYEADWFGENFEKRMEQRMKNLSQSAQGYGLGIQKIKEWLKQPHTDKE